MADAAGVAAVLFDLDDTLCEYRRTSAELLEVSFDRVGVDPLFDVADYYDRYRAFVDESDGMADLRERAFASLVEERGRDPELGRELARVYADERDHSNVRPMPGAVETVRALARDYRLGLVTNGAPGMQRRKLAGIGLEDVFETRVFAGYDVPAKPAPDPFHRALADLDVEPDRAVHVGNSPGSDVAGARGAGLRAVYAPAGSPAGTPDDPDPTPDYRVDALDELLAPPWE